MSNNEEDIVEIIEMVEDQFGAETQAEGDTQTEKPKVVRKKKKGNTKVKAKAKKDEGPKLNDWVRIKKSGGNGLPNQTIHIRLDPENGLATIVTNAFEAEGSDQMEGERTQMFKFTSYEIVEGN